MKVTRYSDKMITKRSLKKNGSSMFKMARACSVVKHRFFNFRCAKSSKTVTARLKGCHKIIINGICNGGIPILTIEFFKRTKKLYVPVLFEAK